MCNLKLLLLMLIASSTGLIFSIETDKTIFRLTKFMSETESSKVSTTGRYHVGQLNDGLRRFLSKNCAALPEERIREIKEEFNDKFFGGEVGLAAGRCMALQDEVDTYFSECIKELRLDIGTVVAPKLDHCVICMFDIEEDREVERGTCHKAHVFHSECIRPALEIKPGICPLCRGELHPDYIKMLLDAAGIGNLDQLNIAIAAGVDVNAKNLGYTALVLAARDGYLEIVNRLLLVDGINVNVKSERGNTALMQASKWGHIEIINRLLEVEGIDINARNDNGLTALDIARRTRRQDIVDTLLCRYDAAERLTYVVFCGNLDQLNTAIAAGVDVNAKNRYGDTALALAAREARLEMVNRLLLVDGINVNVKNERGKTALMQASKPGHIEIVNRLLEVEGIDINAKNDNGLTALDIAIENGHKEIVEILEKHLK